jgi:hypothetical protein
MRAECSFQYVIRLVYWIIRLMKSFFPNDPIRSDFITRKITKQRFFLTCNSMFSTALTHQNTQKLKKHMKKRRLMLANGHRRGVLT